MTKKNTLNFLILLTFIRPHFGFTGGFISTYFGDILILLVLMITMFTHNIRINYRIFKIHYVTLIFYFGFMIPTVINLMKTGFDINILVDYFKIIYYCGIFYLVVQMSHQEKEIIPHMNKLLNLVYLVNVFIAIVQLLDPPFLGLLVRSIYGSVKLRSLWTGHPRVYGTFYNANWFGVYIMFYFAWVVNYASYIKRNFNSIDFLKIIGLFILLIVSGSRTAMIGLLVILFIYVIDNFHFKKLILISVISIVINMILEKFLIKIELFNKTILRFQVFILSIFTEETNTSEIGSIAGRVSSWNLTLEDFLTSPIFGSGNTTSVIAHNSYLHFLNAFGIYGIIILAMILFFMLFKNNSNKQIKKNQIPFFRSWNLTFIPAFLIVSLTAEFFFTTQIMLMIIIVWALQYSIET